MLLAAHAQCALRNADRLADFRDVERVSRVLLHHAVEASHDDRVLALRQPGLAVVAILEATDDGFDQRLLQTPRGIGIGDNFRGVFRQAPRRVQPLELHHRRCRRGMDQRIFRRRQVNSGDCRPAGNHYFHRQ
jgi:hypothetical protein